MSSSGKADISYMYIYDLYGQLWARQDKESGKLQYYQLNGHGDVVGLVDANGKTLNSYTYDIWGGPLTEEETVPNTLRYAGEYWDDTTGLQYLRARWYDPGTARFMGEDTYEGSINNPLSLNLYTYVENNPLRYTDPSGHIKAEPYDIQQLRISLNQAREKTNSNRNNFNYQLHKDFLQNHYDFYSMMDKNRYNYLYDLITGTSAYTNNAGTSDWAREQLISAYFKAKEAEYIAYLAMGMAGGIGGGKSNVGNKISKGTAKVLKFTPNKNGYYGTVGQSGSTKVRNITGGNKAARQFYEEKTQGFKTEKNLGDGKVLRIMDDETAITYRSVSHSDGTPAVDINGGSTFKQQKIHFIP